MESVPNEEIYNRIKNGSRKRELKEYKFRYISMAIKNNYDYNEIGLNIGISESAISKIYNSMLNDIAI